MRLIFQYAIRLQGFILPGKGEADCPLHYRESPISCSESDPLPASSFCQRHETVLISSQIWLRSFFGHAIGTSDASNSWCRPTWTGGGSRRPQLGQPLIFGTKGLPPHDPDVAESVTEDRAHRTPPTRRGDDLERNPGRHASSWPTSRTNPAKTARTCRPDPRGMCAKDSGVKAPDGRYGLRHRPRRCL